MQCVVLLALMLHICQVLYSMLCSMSLKSSFKLLHDITRCGAMVRWLTCRQVTWDGGDMLCQLSSCVPVQLYWWRVCTVHCSGDYLWQGESSVPACYLYGVCKGWNALAVNTAMGLTALLTASDSCRKKDNLFRQPSVWLCTRPYVSACLK